MAFFRHPIWGDPKFGRGKEEYQRNELIIGVKIHFSFTQLFILPWRGDAVNIHSGLRLYCRLV